MGEVMKTWLRTRLGVIMDLRPEIFGHYTRDGTLLAQILHTYDIITHIQLETIIPTQDPALARVNLRLLRVWLRFLGIVLSDDAIHEISRGKGITALRLFYKLYLCLESKDSLHFISQQKEREKYLPQSTKFDVTTVPEDPPPYEPTAHPLSKKLCEQKETVVEWHRPKLLSILKKCKQEREKIAAAVAVIQTRTSKDNNLVEKFDLSEEILTESKQADEFARAHRARPLRQNDYTEDRIEMELSMIPPAEDPAKAKIYVDEIKKRRKQIADAEVVKSRMQMSLITEILKTSEEEQQEEFDEEMARRVLDQSRYEKQIITKLCEVREQKSIIVENQKIVDDLIQKAKEQEHSLQDEREKDKLTKVADRVDSEYRRLCELHRRIRQEKIRKIREKHYEFCSEVLEDLINISIKATEYRQANTEIPLSVWCQWKSLFVKGQSVFEEVNVDDINDDVEEEAELFHITIERAGILRDAAFQAYIHLEAPWDGFAPELTEEQQEILKKGSRVLGYIVHRLIQRLYSSSMDNSLQIILKPERIALVLGIPSTNIFEPLQQLINECGVQLIRMEDAINHCLTAYKSEMTDFEYIDLNIIKATESALTKILSKTDVKKDLTPKKKGQKERAKKVEGKAEGKAEVKALKLPKQQAKTLEEKETQTPRAIPFDDLDPILSNTAYIGKWSYEFLTLGQPISNELLNQALLEYLKSLVGSKGWVIVDYPRTYEQMALMEYSMTGRQIPPDPKPLDFKNIDVEDIDPLPPRIVFEDKNSGPLNRLSSLVPNPISASDTQDETLVFPSIYVKVVPKPKNFEIDPQQPYEVLSSNASMVDLFYAHHEKAYAFYYSVLDNSTLNKLAKLITGSPIRSTTSREQFTDSSGNQSGFLRYGESKHPIVRRLVSRISYQDIPEEETLEEDEVQSSEQQIEIVDAEVKPGDTNWKWVELPLPSDLMDTLATLWENLEQSYIDSVKEMLLLKSIHASSILPYADFVKRNMKRYIERKDERQGLLVEFQHAFNTIDEDARDDSDVKCELHRRVADFQARLWDISDLKREEAEGERRRIIDNHWATREIIILFNVYTGLLQAELDRSIDTLHLIQDYYLSMLQKPLQDYSLNKNVLASRMDLLEDSEEFEEKSSNQKGPKMQSRSKSTLQGNLDRRQLADFVTDRLINSEENSSENPACKGILEHVKYAQSSIDTVSSSINEALKKESAVISKPSGKDSSRKKTPDGRGDSIPSKVAEPILEWQSAFNYETNRIRFQFQVLASAAQADMTFLLESMSRAFRDIYDSIIQRYNNEINSINCMANAFCFAIEEGKPIQEKMMLLEDRFVVRGKDIPGQTVIREPDEIPSRETRLSLTQMIELCRLMGIFRRVAPQGILSERSFIYILQDMVRHGEECGVLLFPCFWYQLSPSEIRTLVHRLFGGAEFIQWREFIIYSMNLPMPSHKDILIARQLFRKQDPTLSESVTPEQFYCTPLWFPEAGKIAADLNQMLHDKIFGNSVSSLGREKFEVLLRQRSSILNRGQNYNEFDSRESQVLLLAKEILCQLFLTSRDTVNYTALLLSFCKDLDPREGFGKALTLAIGNIVCTDQELGENYVERLYGRIDSVEQQESCHEYQSEASEVAGELSQVMLPVEQEQVITTPVPGSRGDEPLFGDKLMTEKLGTSGEGDVSKIQSAESYGENMEGIFFGDLSSEPDIDTLSICHWVPREICLTVLAAVLPSRLEHLDPFGNSMSLKEAIRFIYHDLWDATLKPDRRTILSHRLLRHPIISNLLENISHFTEKHPADLIDEIIRDRETPPREFNLFH